MVRTASCHVGHYGNHWITEVKQRWARILDGCWVTTQITCMPGTVKRCTRILWPGKASEKTPRVVFSPACVKYLRKPQEKGLLVGMSQSVGPRHRTKFSQNIPEKGCLNCPYTLSPITLSPVTLSRSFCPLVTLSPITLSPGHFFPGHFVPNRFVPRSLCPQVILSPVRLCDSGDFTI
jgi:hypothetical protein